jgi:hypothetical protein
MVPESDEPVTANGVATMLLVSTACATPVPEIVV